MAQTGKVAPKIKETFARSWLAFWSWARLMLAASLLVVVAVLGFAAVLLWWLAPSLPIMAWIDAGVSTAAGATVIALTWGDRETLRRARKLAIRVCVVICVLLFLSRKLNSSVWESMAYYLKDRLINSNCNEDVIAESNTTYPRFVARLVDTGRPGSREKTLYLRWSKDSTSPTARVLSIDEYRVAVGMFPASWHHAIYSATTPEVQFEFALTFTCPAPMDAPTRAH